MIIWMEVTKDIYELPVAVADSQKELATLCGVRQDTIKSVIYHSRQRGHKCSYVKVEIEEDE